MAITDLWVERRSTAPDVRMIRADIIEQASWLRPPSDGTGALNSAPARRRNASGLGISSWPARSAAWLSAAPAAPPPVTPPATTVRAVTPQDRHRTRNGERKDCSRHPDRQRSRRSSLDSHTMRNEYNVDQLLGDAVAIVSHVLAKTARHRPW